MPAYFPRLSLDGIELKPYRCYVFTLEVNMRRLLGLFCVLLLAFAAGSVAHQQPQPNACGFTVQASSTKPEVTGPPDLVPLVYVVDQPDSPIEIQSINLDGSWLSVSGDRYTERTCAHYQVRNRSDRVIQHFEVLLGYSTLSNAGASNYAAISPGQTTELIACGIGGTGGVRGNPMRIVISVGRIVFDDCFFRPSVRVSLSAGIKAFWLW